MVDFAGRAARALGGRRLAEQRQHAFVAQLLQAFVVAALVVQRVRVEAEVTGVDEPPDRRIQHDHGAARDGVRDAHQLHEEFADFEAFVRVFVHGDGPQLKAVGHRQTEVFEDFLDAADGELAAVNRRRELRHDVRQTTDVVQVAVGNQISPQFVLDLLQIGRVGDAVVDARQVDAQVVAAVHDDGVVYVFDQDHVLGAAAVHAAQTDDFQARAVIDDIGAPWRGLPLVSADTYWLAMRWASCWLRR